MTESLVDDTCLESITHSCCEGARRPFKDRHLRTPEIADCPSQCVVMPVTDEVWPKFVEEVKEPCEVESVIQERESVYGPPSVNLDCIARHWQAYLDNRNPGRLTIQDVCNMMVLTKISRMARTPEHADSVKDIKAYRKIAEEVK